ncbi:MAG: hypothetical protein QOE65_2888 [Solirubrobacteraceae bacterium]|jgi:hypothetical protein|nr:hypothetical protein [Solirubrobacteraceae bacterium]
MAARRGATVAAAAALVLAAAGPARAAEPGLTVPAARLAAALKCTPDVDHAARTPLMLVTGTGVSGDEAYAIGKPAFDRAHIPLCYVNFPHHTTADVQVSVQYLVHGLRTMHRRAGRKLVVFGISQGGLLARTALTYWPSLRPWVTDVISAAGTQHGTTVGSFADCAPRGCVPAAFQQARGSHFLAALNAQPDETPGRTAWTTVRSATDEIVKPQTGRHPTSSLDGAANILIQRVCPGRRTNHFGTAVDSVTYEAIVDAAYHRGPARVSRFPSDVCAHPYAPGLEEGATATLIQAGGALAADRGDSEPKVRREPAVRAWAARIARVSGG